MGELQRIWLLLVVGSAGLGLIVSVLCIKIVLGRKIFHSIYTWIIISAITTGIIFLNLKTGSRQTLFVTILLNSGIDFLWFAGRLGRLDRTVYERASVDGADSRQIFLRITLPVLVPMMCGMLALNSVHTLLQLW